LNQRIKNIFGLGTAVFVVLGILVFFVFQVSALYLTHKGDV